MGIAAGIHKRRWQDLGQLQDLQNAAKLYSRGAGVNMGEDAYAHINAAFLDDMLAQLGDDTKARQQLAQVLRENIVSDLPVFSSWFNIACRAEALFGLRRYKEATEVLVAGAVNRPEPWELLTTITQLGQLAYLLEPSPMNNPDIRDFFYCFASGQS